MTKEELDTLIHEYCNGKSCRCCKLKIPPGVYLCNNSQLDNEEHYALLMYILEAEGLLKQLDMTENDIMELLQ